MALLKLEDISEAWIYIFDLVIYPKQFSKKPTKIANPGPERPKNGQIGGNPQALEILSKSLIAWTKPAHSMCPLHVDP